MELCRSYVNAINKGNVPCIENAWNYVLKHESEKLIRNLTMEYQKYIKGSLPKKSDESLIGVLHKLHEGIVPKLVEKFRDSTLTEDMKGLEPNLLSAIDDAFKTFMQHCEIKEQSRCEEFLKYRLDDIERNLRKGEYESMVQFNEALKLLQNEYHQNFPYFNRQTSLNLWRGNTERIVYKAGEYISRSISDKARNESILLQTQLANLQKSYEKIAAELDQERTRKANDIRDVEKKNATLKSTMKMIEEKFILTEKSKEEEITLIKQQKAESEVSLV